MYKNPYTKAAQIFAPAIIRVGFNLCTGQSALTGVAITFPLYLMSKVQNETQDSHSIWVNAIKHQLLSAMFYGMLSTCGVDKNVAAFASKMGATLLYSSRYSDKFNMNNSLATIAVDVVNLGMDVARFNEIPFFVNFVSRAVMNFYVVYITCGFDKLNAQSVAMILSPTLVSAVIPLDITSPIIGMLPQSIGEFFCTTISPEFGVAV